MIGSIIGLLIIGAILGYLGRLVLPGAQDIGIIRTVLLGVVAAVATGIILNLVMDSPGIFSTLIVGAVVAAVLLWAAIQTKILRA
ncbi:MAG: GlsB/YeaQ/YmgE family stress response membrane protein [Actinomycetota bacterium]